jgi:capsular polysaccharide biosynthesis protein
MNDVNDYPIDQLSGFTSEEDEIASLKAFLQVIRRRWLAVLAVSLLSVGIAVGLSSIQEQEYSASIYMLIGQKSSANPVYTPSIPNVDQLTATMAKAVDTRPIAQSVVTELNLKTSPDALLANLSATPVEGTQFIQVTYVNNNPDRARRVINAIGDEFAKEVAHISPSTNYVAATLWDPATKATPTGMGLPQMIALALALGVIIGTSLAFVLEALDDSWQSPEELEQLSEVPIYGVVPTIRF